MGSSISNSLHLQSAAKERTCIADRFSAAQHDQHQKGFERPDSREKAHPAAVLKQRYLWCRCYLRGQFCLRGRCYLRGQFCLRDRCCLWSVTLPYEAEREVGQYEWPNVRYCPVTDLYRPWLDPNWGSSCSWYFCYTSCTCMCTTNYVVYAMQLVSA